MRTEGHSRSGSSSSSSSNGARISGVRGVIDNCHGLVSVVAGKAPVVAVVVAVAVVAVVSVVAGKALVVAVMAVVAVIAVETAVAGGT